MARTRFPSHWRWLLASAALVAGCGERGDVRGDRLNGEIDPWSVRYAKISQTAGGFGGELADFDAFGSSVAAIGDVNRDGVGDLAVGAIWDEDPRTLEAPGAVWIVFLSEDGSVVSQTKIVPGIGGFAEQLEDGAQLGAALAGPGDVDGDGIPDLLVTSPGNRTGAQIWLMFLQVDGSVRETTTIEPGEDVRSTAGALAALGDVNGDGTADIAALVQSSVAVVLLGRDGAVIGTQSVFVENVSGARDWLLAVASPGDVDGDGLGDLAVWRESGGYVGLLRADGTVESTQSFTADLWPYRYGFHDKGMARLGDLDGDGRDELAMLGTGYARGWQYDGRAIVVFYLDADGRRSKVRALPIDDDVIGDDAATQGTTLFGSSLGGVGDLDGDGSMELAAGMPRDDDGGRKRGAVWILSLGNPSDVSTTSLPSTTTTTTTSTTSTTECPPEYCGAEDDPIVLGSRAILPEDVGYTEAFGVHSLGDLDGDGVAELGYRVQVADETCGWTHALRTVHLDAAGGVRALGEVNATGVPGASQCLRLDTPVTPLGDVDGDGVGDLAARVYDDDSAPRLAVLFLDAAGAVRAVGELGGANGGFSPPEAGFASALSGVGDVDGDGVPDLAAGSGDWFGGVWLLFLERDGSVRQSTQLLDGFAPGQWTGAAVSALGDLDGDGVSELAVGAPLRSSGGDSVDGSVFLLFLDTSGRVRCRPEITANAGGFAGLLPDEGGFGWQLAAVGDLDGDGRSELAVGTLDRERTPLSVWLLFLNTDGTVRAQRKITLSDPLLPALGDHASLVAPGDVNGDGVPDLAAGVSYTPLDTEGSTGAIVTLFLADFEGRVPPPAPAAECDELPAPQEPDGEYDIAIDLLTARAFGGLQLEIDYSAVAGDLAGSHADVECTVDAKGGVLTVFNDCDTNAGFCGGRVLRVGWISVQGFTGPTRMATCRFISTGGVPDANDFVVSVVDAVTPPGRPVDADVEIVVTPRG